MNTLRFAWRSLLRSPGFVVIAVLSFIGIFPALFLKRPDPQARDVPAGFAA